MRYRTTKEWWSRTKGALREPDSISYWSATYAEEKLRPKSAWFCTPRLINKLRNCGRNRLVGRRRKTVIIDIVFTHPVFILRTDESDFKWTKQGFRRLPSLDIDLNEVPAIESANETGECKIVYIALFSLHFQFIFSCTFAREQRESCESLKLLAKGSKEPEVFSGSSIIHTYQGKENQVLRQWMETWLGEMWATLQQSGCAHRFGFYVLAQQTFAFRSYSLKIYSHYFSERLLKVNKWNYISFLTNTWSV